MNSLRALERGINFLCRIQGSDGGFESFSSPSVTPFKPKYIYRTTFSSALILSATARLPGGKRVDKLKEHLSDYLLNQVAQNGAFNYWDRDSFEFQKIPFPDDLDDTSCAAAALYSYNPGLVEATLVPKIISLLASNEIQEGGPYYTWVVPADQRNRWNDVDLAVNSNIGYFLSLLGVSLESIERLVGKAARAKDFSSPYYPNFYPLVYFISRFYRGSRVPGIIRYIEAHQNADGGWGNSLNTALALNALLNFKASLKGINRGLGVLLSQQKDGQWDTAAFCLDPAKKGRQYYCGSAALTTAFCLEAIAHHQRVTTKTSVNNKQVPSDIQQAVIKTVKARASKVSGQLQEKILAKVDDLINSERLSEIVLLPYFFTNTLGERGKSIDESTLISLGEASLYGWLAYDIYDDFFDERGDVAALPAANTALRWLTTIFSSFPTKDFASVFEQVMGQLEAANLWEVQTCRLKQTDEGLSPLPKKIPLSYLWQKSFGHVLSVLAVISRLGISSRQRDFRLISSFFAHYLVARQLNDDLHDWESDLTAGRLTLVNADVLKRQGQALKLPDDLSNLRKDYWLKTCPKFSRLILKQITLAKKDLSQVGLIEEPAALERILVPLESAALKALTQRRQTSALINLFTG